MNADKIRVNAMNAANNIINLDVKDMTCNGAGLIYWRGCHVSMLINPKDKQYKPYLMHLREKCERLYAKRIPVNINTAETYFRWFDSMPEDEPYKKLLVRCPSIRSSEQKIAIIFERTACVYEGKVWQFYLLPVRGTTAWFTFFNHVINKNADYEHMSSYSCLHDVVACLRKHHVPTNLLDMMSDHLRKGAK